MFHLIKKDVLMQKRTLLLSLLIMVFFSFSLSSMGTAGLTVSIWAICYLFVYGAGMLEEKTNGDKLLVSLPIRKNTIVMSKYVSVYVFAAYALLVNFIIRMLANLFQIPHFSFPFTLEAVASTFIAVTLIFSLSFPLIFKVGFMKSRLTNFVVLFAFLFGGHAISGQLSNGAGIDFSLARSDTGLTILVVLALLIIVTASFSLSLAFYRRREF
ncbi:ABC-2 transporter permease [Paenibacillus cisolokensis]|uniref:ABC-2 transporter permease n=1 Tax=Paenibacillus cisolokensis TaxID=1658519 RepID=UPI003D295C0E